METTIILSLLTLPLVLGDTLDVVSTVQFIRRPPYDPGRERNPLARRAFLKFGLFRGFTLITVLYWIIVAAAWAWCWFPWPFKPSLWIALATGCMLSPIGVLHILAWRWNRTGKGGRILAPILKLYDRWG